LLIWRLLYNLLCAIQIVALEKRIVALSAKSISYDKRATAYDGIGAL
jgi:hypothetical protein